VEHPDYGKIGEVRVKEIELKSYKDLIYEIKVLTDKDPRLMKALESLFGKAEYDMKNQLYFWKSDRIILKFKATGKNFLELEYSSPVVRNMMKDDKEQKVDDIANDL
jgi:ArsR family metal-binding transcriptional regulator